MVCGEFNFEVMRQKSPHPDGVPDEKGAQDFLEILARLRSATFSVYSGGFR